MITWIWIEGEKALNEFCLRLFKSKPLFRGTIGSVGRARVRLIYKHRGDNIGKCAEMYLLYMYASSGSCSNLARIEDLDKIETMTYEEIKADKTAILRK